MQQELEPIKQAFRLGLQALLVRPCFTVEDQLSALSNLTLNDMQKYQGSFFSQIRISMLAVGNLNARQALAL